MGAAVAALGTATCVLVLLMTSHFAPAIAEDTTTKLAQSDSVITARVTSATKADACSSSVDKAYNLCMINGMFNITRVTCDCIESGVRGAPTWECTGTAACQK